MAGDLPKARREAWNRFSLTASEGTNPAKPRSWTSSFQNCEKMNFCCLSHPVRGTLLWQPEQTNTQGEHLHMH